MHINTHTHAGMHTYTQAHWVAMYSDTDCGGLNENGPHRLTCLNAWYLIDELFWEELGGVTSFEEVCRWVWALRFQKPTSDPSLCLPVCLFVCLYLTFFPFFPPTSNF